MYNLGICDDAKGTCAELEKIILDYAQKRNQKINVDVWYSGESLCEDLKKNEQYDLLFLDIELDKMDGVRVGEFIRNELEDYKLMIVYISSKTNYAMQLFQNQPFDFLIKPIEEEKIEALLDRAFRIRKKGDLCFDFKYGGKLFKVPYENIIHFSSMDKKIQLLTRLKTFYFYGKLKELQMVLPKNFIFIHQSYIINQDYICECTYETVKMMNGELLTISKRYRSEVRKSIKEYQRGRRE